MELMREAEVEKRFYDYRMKAVVTMQRVFRGYRGRKVFFVGKEESHACFASYITVVQVATMFFQCENNYCLSKDIATMLFVQDLKTILL